MSRARQISPTARHASDPIASIVRELGARVGFKDVHVYISARHPHVVVAEPTSPVSVVIGPGLVLAWLLARRRFRDIAHGSGFRLRIVSAISRAILGVARGKKGSRHLLGGW